MVMSPESCIVCGAIDERDLSYDEFEPIDDDTFQAIVADLRCTDDGDDIIKAFKTCFEHDDNGEHYFKTTGRDDFIEAFEEALDDSSALEEPED